MQLTVIPTLHIHLLGDFLLLSEDNPVLTVNSPRLQSLLAYLVLHRSAPQDRSHLAFLLWPDSTEERAHSSLRKLLHQLRQALPDIDYFLHTDRQSLFWQPAAEAAWTLDVQEFEQQLAQAELTERRQETTVMRHALEQAISLYRGDILPSCYDEWILPERDRLRQLFLSAAERLLALLEEDRDYDAAIQIAQQLLRQDTLHEATYRQLMRLHALRGDRAAALRVYHTCAQVLERELGTEPSQATRTLYESLLESDTSPRTPTGPLTLRGTEAPLLGRKVEWHQIQEAWRKATRGVPHVVILSGEAGIGKTRLSEEMEAWVSRQGMTTASARCYAAVGQLAYAPVTTWLHTDTIQSGLSALDPAWLTEIARLVPEVLATRPKLARPTSMAEGWQRRHFFEALAHAVLIARQPLLLLLDDLQWCDNETLEWLHYLLRFDTSAHLLLIGTVRAEDILPGHPLEAFLGALQRDGMVTEIVLGPLATTETTSLAEHVLGHQLEPDMMNLLYAETEGNPLFVVEMARAGTLELDGRVQSAARSSHALLSQAASTLPPTVQNVLATRLAQLSALAREVANVAAVIGREFTFDVLAKASEDDVVQGLDELWQRRIVREQGAGMAQGYDFSHDKLRKQAYDALSPAQRHLLHRRVAESLEAVYAEDLDTLSSQVAAHYERAGLFERAIPYYRRAGEVALGIYANTEAIAAFERAAALLEAGIAGNSWRKKHWKTAAQVYKSLGEIFAITGRQADARQAYQHAINWIPTHEYIWQARLLRKTAVTWKLASDNPLDTLHDNARQMFQEAERILDQVEDKSSSEWLNEWINLQIDQLLPLRGSADEMTAIIDKAQDIVEQHGTAEQRGRFFQAVIARDSKRNRYMGSEQSLAYRRQGLATVLETGNKDLIGFGYFVLANGLLFAEQLEEAEEQMRMAVKLAEEIGSTPLLVRCLTFMAIILRRRGKVEEVRQVIKRALAMPEARNSAIIQGHQAWLAWRDGNLTEAETYGKASLENKQGRQPANSFQWTGIWPLVGVAHAQEKFTEAMDYVRLLLDPTQQPPSKELRIILEAALSVWDAGQVEEAHARLRQALPLAEKMGYL